MTIDPKTRTILARRGEDQRRSTRIRDAAIVQAVNDGASLREVGDAVGMSHMGVRRIVKNESAER